MPEIVMVDEIGTEAEALACRTIAERGVQLVATAHGQLLENLIKNPTLSDLVGGIQSVTLGETPQAAGDISMRCCKFCKWKQCLVLDGVTSYVSLLHACIEQNIHDHLLCMAWA